MSENDREHLVIAAAALGVEVTPEAVRELTRFADILDLWSRRTNLLSCGSSRELVDRHLLDSLAISPLLPLRGTVVDLGSGAGFPGLPLAIVRPHQPFVLVESKQRKASFLSEVRRTLGLHNVEVIAGRAETPPSGYVHQAAVVISRAVWSDEGLVAVAAAWVNEDGMLLRMKAQDSEVIEGRSFTLERTVRYGIEGDRDRAVDVLRFQA
ncbi:MAG: 16S rRNA (guanine(527)-N(7))-methyltransferase RsmG [Deltaproteobacteria bacterium]|nr:16S rRNA (guanine(527)-N(7))-methyltransferase RsmG [Deltaproteobacteria bacterium]